MCTCGVRACVCGSLDVVACLCVCVCVCVCVCGVSVMCKCACSCVRVRVGAYQSLVLPHLCVRMDMYVYVRKCA